MESAAIIVLQVSQYLTANFFYHDTVVTASHVTWYMFFTSMLMLSGKFVKTHCDDTKATECGECAEGFFTATFNRLSQCILCRACSSGKSQLCTLSFTFPCTTCILVFFIILPHSATVHGSLTLLYVVYLATTDVFGFIWQCLCRIHSHKTFNRFYMQIQPAKAFDHTVNKLIRQ